jgi:hypothetical protein
VTGSKALMDDPDEVVAAIEELVEAGIDRDQIFVLCGPDGAERLNIYGRHRGLRGHIFRFVEQFGDVAQNRQKSIDHMKAGGYWMSVPADEADKISVATILGRHEAHDMIHYGPYHQERLGS